ncbi:unnamed protein product [Didymodactylos carnosus]|uniref:tRNA (guanine(37)-N1)-methyltransferase n=1 Tax=Didymodactylos carnosus TaxID=1234261 RepID=A0A815XW34_9BILA|nr:unnamed protein product [Didymodactylos carnosus]CAF4425107.1 unnamed protein product [Didymodactylos carnosus]
MRLPLPTDVKGAQVIDREKFNITIQVPCITVPVEQIRKFDWKNSSLDICQLKCIQDLEPISKTHKQILFDPDMIKNVEDIVKLLPSSIDKSEIEQSFHYKQINITYKNYSVDEIVRAILSNDILEQNVNTGSGYSQIGHIAHFNLRDAVLPYKHIIAQVILDKLSSIKTVVNKLHKIDNVYRNFDFEILAGEQNTIVTCKENNETFKFDFAKVYWNPRLGSERERVLKLVHSRDYVFDIFSGVGPFSIQAAHKGCTVYANDINPECVKWMDLNYKYNQSKSKGRRYGDHKSYNLDGREFLTTIVFPQIEQIQHEILSNEEKCQHYSNDKIVLFMNLPEIALTFLDVFLAWLSKHEDNNGKWMLPIHIYCYTFSKDENKTHDITERLENILPGVECDDIHFVRQVSPNKDMMCVTIKLFEKKNEKNKKAPNCDNNEIEEEKQDVKRFKQSV